MDWILDLLLYAHRWYVLHIQDCRLGLVNNKKQYDIVILIPYNVIIFKMSLVQRNYSNILFYILCYIYCTGYILIQDGLP